MDSVVEPTEEQPLLHPEYSYPKRQKCSLPSFKVFSIIFTGSLFLVATMVFAFTSSRQYKKINDVDNLEPNIPASEKLLRQSWEDGKKYVTEIKNLEFQVYEKGIFPHNDSAWTTMQNLFNANTPIRNLAECAMIVEHMKRNSKQCFNATYLPDYCKIARPSKCEGRNMYYRTYNGSCNNLKNPEWGMSQNAFLRLLEADYADGVSEPRKSINGDPLPNPRLISNHFYVHQNLPDANFTLLAMTYGLFIDHDMINSAAQTGYGGTFITCCDKRILSKFKHPECYEIRIPSSDPFYGPRNVTCIDFVRSKPIPGKCAGKREQFNIVSSYIDGSAIYGPSEELNQKLRSFHDGLLASRRVNGHYLLPVDHKQKCGPIKRPVTCMAAGDNRVNENIDLTSMHNLWFREHNKVATKLRLLHPNWDDEKLFQEARRIVAAEIQFITYNEFLPLLLGPEAIEEYGLSLDVNDKYDKYDSNEESGVYNVFSAAAFRFGHSMIQSLLKIYDDNYNVNDIIALHKTFSNPKLLYEGAYDAVIRGMLQQRTHSVDNYITPEVRNRLFQPVTSSSGLDLSAYGIQRGRDHGIPSYPAWRKVCGLPVIESWDDMYLAMRKESVEKLKEIYSSVHDIDLIPAALAEYHVEGAMLGPTYVCLIGKQFQNLRVSDRFWFEVRDEPWSFTNDQVKEIYKSSMSRIVCDNSDKIRSLQMKAFLVPSDSNPVVNCEDIPVLNFSKW